MMAFYQDICYCFVQYPDKVGGDNFCDHDITTYNTYSCGFDGGDCCLELNKYPNCDVNTPGWIGNNSICDRDKDGYNTEEECGFDGGDCDPGFYAKYPLCNATELLRIGKASVMVGCTTPLGVA